MIVVKGEVRVKPDRQDEVIGALHGLIESTRAEEGCAVYVFARDVADPNLVHVFEQWAGEEALNAHMAAPHLAEFMTAAAGAVESASFTRYDVSGTRSLLG